MQLPCKTKSETVARAKLRAEMRKTDEQFIAPKHKKVTVGELFDAALLHWTAQNLHDYCERSQARWNAHLKAEFAHVKAALFGTEHINRYRAKRSQEGAALSTINRELQLVRQAFRLGADAEPPTVKRVPKFKLPKEEAVRKGFATVQQVESLKAAAAKESLSMRVLVEIAFTYGWRRGDLLYLRVKDVRLAENALRLEDSKNGEPRQVPLTASLRTLLTGLIAGRPAEEHLWGGSLSGFKLAWNRVREAAGCPEIILHDARRTSARNKRSAGIDTSIIMEMQGWKTEAMFRRYGIVNYQDKATALAKQEEFEREQLKPETTTN